MKSVSNNHRTERNRASDGGDEECDDEGINESVSLQEFVELPLASDENDELAMALDEQGAAETANHAEKHVGEDFVGVPHVLEDEGGLEQRQDIHGLLIQELKASEEEGTSERR